jgi:hypothetical protein
VTPYRVVVGYRRFGGPVASIFRLDLWNIGILQSRWCMDSYRHAHLSMWWNWWTIFASYMKIKWFAIWTLSWGGWMPETWRTSNSYLQISNTDLRADLVWIASHKPLLIHFTYFSIVNTTES